MVQYLNRLGKDPRTLRKLVVMNASYVPPEILRNLPYEYRVPINDLDDLELFMKEEFNSTDLSNFDDDMWVFKEMN